MSYIFYITICNTFLGLICYYYSSQLLALFNENKVAIGFKAISIYNSVKKNCYNTYLCIYHFHPKITFFIDNIHYSYHIYNATNLGLTVQPFSKYWIANIYYCKHFHNFYNFYYYKQLHHYDHISHILNLFQHIYNSSILRTSANYNNSYLLQKIILCRINDIYVSRISNFTQDNVFSNLTKNIQDSFFQKSNVSFLTIELACNNHVYSISLDKSFFYVNNQILSTAFIKYYFQHNLPNENLLISYDDYTIHLMDNNINTFTIQNNQYITLSENSYQIENI